jgi:carbon storage regulator
MLVLTRRIGETLVIDGDIRVTVLDTPTNQVRIGIEAPRNVSVHREEVFNRIQATDVAEYVPRPVPNADTPPVTVSTRRRISLVR